MKQYPFTGILMNFFPPHWVRKIIGLLTTFWLPTQFLRELRELRRLVETMENGSQEAFAKKKMAFDAEDMGMRDAKPLSQAKDMMAIMCKLHG